MISLQALGGIMDEEWKAIRETTTAPRRLLVHSRLGIGCKMRNMLPLSHGAMIFLQQFPQQQFLRCVERNRMNALSLTLSFRFVTI
jgi:hypothetical protein